jgi:hypothetical protein
MGNIEGMLRLRSSGKMLAHNHGFQSKLAWDLIIGKFIELEMLICLRELNSPFSSL